MARWIRFQQGSRVGIGTLDGDAIAVHEGDLFDAPRPTGETLDLAVVKVLIPCIAPKMICLWNNFAANAQKQNLPQPAEPLWFIKAATSYLARRTDQTAALL